jgi:hypothetical protein
VNRISFYAENETFHKKIKDKRQKTKERRRGGVQVPGRRNLFLFTGNRTSGSNKDVCRDVASGNHI